MKTLPVYLQISTRENQTDKHNLLGDQCFRGRMGHKNDDKARKIKKVSFPKGIQKYLKLSLSINIIIQYLSMFYLISCYSEHCSNPIGRSKDSRHRIYIRIFHFNLEQFFITSFHSKMNNYKNNTSFVGTERPMVQNNITDIKFITFI